MLTGLRKEVKFSGEYRTVEVISTDIYFPPQWTKFYVTVK